MLGLYRMLVALVPVEKKHETTGADLAAAKEDEESMETTLKANWKTMKHMMHKSASSLGASGCEGSG